MYWNQIEALRQRNKVSRHFYPIFGHQAFLDCKRGIFITYKKELSIQVFNFIVSWLLIKVSVTYCSKTSIMKSNYI